jgi:hypothetical protein
MGMGFLGVMVARWFGVSVYSEQVDAGRISDWVRGDAAGEVVEGDRRS